MKAAIIFCLVVLILNLGVGEADDIFEKVAQWMTDNPGWTWTLLFQGVEETGPWTGPWTGSRPPFLG